MEKHFVKIPTIFNVFDKNICVNHKLFIELALCDVHSLQNWNIICLGEGAFHCRFSGLQFNKHYIAWNVYSSHYIRKDENDPGMEYIIGIKYIKPFEILSNLTHTDEFFKDVIQVIPEKLQILNFSIEENIISKNDVLNKLKNLLNIDKIISSKNNIRNCLKC